MGKIIIAVGALASLALGFFLWESTTRNQYPPSGEPMKVMNGTGEPGALQVVGSFEDGDAVRFLLRMAPPRVWSYIREGDELRVQGRSVTLLKTEYSLLQWEVRRGGEMAYFNEPAAWRFWGILTLIAGGPLLLAALIAGATALASGKRTTV